MENPWQKLAAKPPYVLEGDRAAVENFNLQLSRELSVEEAENYKLQLQCYPEPFMGNPKAPVVLLTLNPGFNPNTSTDYPDSRLSVLQKSLTHQPLDYPFYFLDPAMAEHSGSEWWKPRLRTLIKGDNNNPNGIGEFDAKFVANNLLNIEFFPYHSRKANWFHRLGNLPSQQYSFYLVNQAIERNAIIIFMRNSAIWQQHVPALVGYSHLYALNSTQAIYLTENNCPVGYLEIVKHFNLVKKLQASSAKQS